MDHKALYVLAQFDEKTSNTLNGYYKILQDQGFVGQQTKNIPYHITLGSYDTSYENRLCEDLDLICAKTDPIEIRLNHIGLFGLSVMFIEPNMNFELLNLQKSFFEDCTKGAHNWCAHATILIDEPDAIRKALPILVQHFEPMQARIESIGLYEFFPARCIKECSLRRRGGHE